MAMTNEEILDRVTSIIAEVTDIPKAELLPAKSLREDLEIDSLTTVDLAVTIQDELDIEVEDDQLRELRTIQDVVDLVRSSLLATAS